MTATHGLNTPQRRKRRGLKLLGASLSLVLAAGYAVSITTASPALAAAGASVVIDKDVNGLKEVRDLRPGDLLTYTIDFAANDDDADGPVRVTDALPAAFAGWEIVGVTARFNGSEAGLTLDLPEVTSGPAPATPASGTLSLDPELLTITVEVALPVFPGIGNTSELGLPSGGSGILSYSIVIPATLGTDDPVLRTDLVNTATISAFAGQRPISDWSSALVEIDNPVLPEAVPAKTWVPAVQAYAPGEISTVTIGATQASTGPAIAIELQDPADPALTPDGATELPAGNPFNHVDFAGFVAPTDPTLAPPSGVDRVLVDVYRMQGGSWSWAPWDAAVAPDTIAGVKVRYEADTAAIEPGTILSQSFEVVQRDTHRASGDPLTSGWELSNTMSATIIVPDQEQRSFQASADFAAIASRVDVRSEKRFRELPAGTEVESLTASAGDTVGVVLRAVNREAPYSSVLTSLTITEPASAPAGDPATSPEYFGDNLAFGGFDNSQPAEIWPIGATGGTLTWVTDTNAVTVNLTAGSALPAQPAGEKVRGFVIEFTGDIPAAGVSIIRYRIATNGSEDYIPDGGSAGPFLNRVEVTGESATMQPDTDRSTARLTLSAPKITVGLIKRIGPANVLPGQRVNVQLDTSVQASGSSLKPNKIVVEDSLAGAQNAVIADASSFWNAFDLKQVVPPITRPLIPGLPGVQSDLDIYLADDAGVWDTTAWERNPDANTPLDVPDGVTGIRFVYSTSVEFSQSSFFKPNLAFQARDTLRNDPGIPTSQEFPKLSSYTNLATAEASGKVGARDVTGSDSARQQAGIRGDTDEESPKIGDGTWARKAWGKPSLTAQSESPVTSLQRWAVVDPGFDSVTLQDPAATTASGAGTVFAAFDLTHIRPIGVTRPPTNGTVDARFAWDSVVRVELYDGTQWTPAPAPQNGWMSPTTAADGGGFRGYTLTPDEQQSTIAVRFIVEENVTARTAAAASGDITAPAVGSGVSASADIREYRLDWRLRNQARTTSADLVWVTGTVGFNCYPDPLPVPFPAPFAGCVENTVAVIGNVGGAASKTAVADARINIINGVTNVGLSKRVQALSPSGTPTGLAGTQLNLPVPGIADGVQPQDFPKARIVLTGTNTSEAPTDASGAMQLGRIHVTDSRDSQAPDIALGASMFEGRDFVVESENAADGNPFNQFDVLRVSYGTLPAVIDTSESQVEVWLYDGTNPAGNTQLFTLQQVLDNDPAFTALLPQVVGVSTSFSVADPETNGNGITAGTSLQMNLDVQLRATKRVGGSPVVGGNSVLPVTVANKASVLGWDAAVYPDRFIADSATASFTLVEAGIAVTATKSLSVSHEGAVRNQIVYETEPGALVRVSLGALSSGSTAPIQRLRLQDDTVSFWKRFQLDSVSSPVMPQGADTALVQAMVNGKWVNFDGFAGELSEVHGIRVDYTRIEGSGLFPAGAAAWNTSWGSASLPFAVTLRPGATVDWLNGSETNTMTAEVTAPSHDRAEDIASSTVTFSPGTHRLRVEKHAPNDVGRHEVDALVAYPWELTFTNTGNSFMPITSVVDELPDTLSWSGDVPRYVSTAGSQGLTGLTSDDSTIGVELADDQRSLVFTWPQGQRMYPGESMTIRVPLELEPVPTGTQAVNSVVVQTGVDLATCVQPTDRGQTPVRPSAANECSNRNFVVPTVGNAASTVKSVRGESTNTLGENLVQGAVDVRTLEACQLPLTPLVPEGYSRYPCAATSVLGGTDSWNIQSANTGSSDLARMVVVDMLPRPGDRLLGGAVRESSYRPVLVGESLNEVFRFTGLPDGAVVVVEVTTNPDACIGPDPDASLWTRDPVCEDIASNPANVWVTADDYSGSLEEIAGIRFDFGMSQTPMRPAERIGIEFETVNRTGDGTDEKLAPQLARFSEDQFAWNQDGVVAWNTEGVRVTLPVAPRRAGVMIATGDLVISKQVLGDGVALAPATVDVELSCTVPSGVSEPERADLDLGEYALIAVPANGSVTVPNVPIGANCIASEVGVLGAFGETGRAVLAAPGVTPAADGLSAEVQLRVQFGGSTVLRFANTYTDGSRGGSLERTGFGSIAGVAVAIALLLLIGGGAALGISRAHRRSTR